jgi:hypothetical protein
MLITVAGSAIALEIDQSWLLSNGPAPYLLDQAGTTYVLQSNVNVPGAAFVIKAPNITLDLNGKTITYDNAPGILIANGDFENGATEWSLGGGAIFAGDYLKGQIFSGEHSLKFNTSGGEQSAVYSRYISLEPNAEYSVSALLSDTSAAVRFVELRGINNSNVYAASQGERTWRGMQYSEIQFTTGGSAETYQVVVGIKNIVELDKDVFIDDVSVQQINNHGISIQEDGVVVRNGIIVQGQGNSAWSHGLYIRGNAECANLTVTVYGPNSTNIEGNWSKNMRIHDNVLYNNVNVIRRRDQFHGRSIASKGTNNEFYRNRIVGGPQMGIVSSGGANHIYENSISLKTKYTNGFAIMIWADKGSRVHDNIIDCVSGDYSCRGIHGAGEDSPGTKIFNNSISVRELKRNQEYGGCVLSGAYGIQIETGSNYEVYNNIVKAVAETCDAHAYRDNGGTRSTAYIHDNHFIAESKSSEVDASTAKLADMSAPAMLRFENNILETNSLWFGESMSLNGILTHANHIRMASSVLEPFTPFEAHNWRRNAELAPHIKFVDNVYSDKRTHDAFVSASYVYYNVKKSPDVHASWTHAFTTTIEMLGEQHLPAKGMEIVLRDRHGREAFRGVTDEAGRTAVVLDEFVNAGGMVTTYGPYSLTASQGDQTLNYSFNVDKTLLVSCVMGAGCSESEVPPPSVPLTPKPPKGGDAPIDIVSPATNARMKNNFNLSSDAVLDIACQNNVQIINRQGKLIRELSCTGNNVTWDGRASSGGIVSAGVYILVEASRANRKVVVVK